MSGLLLEGWDSLLAVPETWMDEWIRLGMSSGGKFSGLRVRRRKMSGSFPGGDGAAAWLELRRWLGRRNFETRV